MPSTFTITRESSDKGLDHPVKKLIKIMIGINYRKENLEWMIEKGHQLMASKSNVATSFEVSLNMAKLVRETNGCNWHKRWVMVVTLLSQSTHHSAARNISW